MKSYLYNTILDTKTRHNKLVKEREIEYGNEDMTSPEKVFNIMTNVFELHKMAEEYTYMIALNTKSKPIGFFEVSHGTVNGSFLTPREIFIRALLSDATYIIIVHNHPSFDSAPSPEDIKLTRRIKEAGNLIGIQLLDHLRFVFFAN